MAAVTAYTREILDAAGISCEVRRGGAGAPLLFIHGEFGLPGWTEACERLAEHFDVIAPSLPGYGGSARPDWMMSQRDLAAWITWFVRDRGIATPLNAIGLSLGGWALAEIATVSPGFFRKMLLCGPMGLKPEKGEIFDYFLESGLTGLRRSFLNPADSPEFAKYWGRELTPDETDMIDQNREITCRIAWKPWMHSLTLRNLLGGVKTSTLIVQGKEDAITPLNCGEIYRDAIPGARLVTIPACGHMAEMEKPADFVAIAREFFAG
jgi:pimeloyl-ACP methyl ester carboxylesterase